MDLTIGSGWSFGGPLHHAGARREPPALGAPRDRRRASPASRVREPFEHDRLVAAFIAPGSTQEADPGVLSAAGDSRARPDPAAAGSGSARRAAVLRRPDRPGREACRGRRRRATCSITTAARPIATHLREAGDKLLARRRARLDRLRVLRQPRGLRRRLDRAISSRSSSKRRGYDLRPLLPIAELGNGERADAVRRDYGRTLTELFEERFLAPMHEWAAKNHVRFRIQNYGLPPARAGQLPPRRRLRRRRIRVAHRCRRRAGPRPRRTSSASRSPRPRPGRGCIRRRSARRRSI